MLAISPYTLIFYAICLLSTESVLTFSNDWQQKFVITRNLSEALVEVITGLYVEEAQQRVFNFQVKVTNNNEKYLNEFLKIIDETMGMLNGSIAVRLKIGSAITPDNERHFCVLLVDSSESLQYLYKDLSKFHLFTEGSYFIILQTVPCVSHYYDELFEIFQLNSLNGIIHSDVLVHAVNNVILLFHYMPFTKFHCKGIAPVIHNKFIDGHWLHKNFYIEKLRNLYGCPLVCATWQDMPYFKLDSGYSQGRSKSRYMGLEGKLLEYLAERLNFTVTMRWLNEKEINQTIYDEQGVFNKLFTTNTDFVIGAFHYKPISLEDPYAPTTAYYLSHYYFIISAKTDPYDSFTKLLLPFETKIWIILIFIFIFANVLLFMLIYENRKWKVIILGRENLSPAYNMVVISLGGAVTKDPKVPFSRFLLILWLLSTFILRTVYQGIMFHIIRSDLRKAPPKLITDLMQREYRIFMTDVVYASLTDLPQLVAKAEVINASEVETFGILRHPEDYEPYKIAILTPLEYFGYYKLITPINSDFYMMPEKLFTQQLSIYMKKNSPFLKRFNKYIKNYVNEGFMNRWERIIVVSSHSRRPMDESPRAMKIANLFAAFRLLFIGLAASLLTFFGEILIFGMKILIRRYRKKIRTAFRIKVK